MNVRTRFTLIIFLLSLITVHTVSAELQQERILIISNTNDNNRAVQHGEEDSDQLDDGNFEAGTPSVYWVESSVNYETPICSVASCGDFGRTGNGYAWFGGKRDTQEQAVLSQKIMIERPQSSRNLELSGWLKIMGEEGRGTLRVAIDGETIAMFNQEDQASYDTWRRIELDMTPYADGVVHRLSIDVMTEPEGLISFFVDDITLQEKVPTAVQMNTIQTTTTTPLVVLALSGLLAMVSVPVYVRVKHA